MKLDETTIDDEKENTCNGNGMPGKLIIKDISSSAEPSNGDLHNDTSSNDHEAATGVGDLLVVDISSSRNDSEENCFQNGGKADDSTSVSSSSSNFPPTDFQQDDITDDEMTLRLSEEEELSEPVNNETDNLYFTSSPLPKGEEINNKEEASTSAVEETSNSEIEKDTNNSVVAEGTNNKTSDSENSEKSNEKHSSSDDNLDTLISDLNEDSKTALKSESEKVTISDLRQEIEDFIKNHDTDDAESETKDSESESTRTENDLETKSDESELNTQISETESVKTEIKIEINNITSVKLEATNEESEINNDLIEFKDVPIEIIKHEVAEKIGEQQNNDSKTIKIESDCIDLNSDKIEIEPSTSNDKKHQKDTNESEEVRKEIDENISENYIEKTDKNISEETNVDDSETKSSVDENKQLETMDTDETNATENIDINKTNESDNLKCQENVNDSEKNETVNLNKSETTETENNKIENEESQITPLENITNIEEIQNPVDNLEEEEEKEYAELQNVPFEPMDVESNETESGIEENIEKSTIINDDEDDVVMKEDFNNTNKETPNEETDNKTVNPEEKLESNKDNDIRDEKVKENKNKIKKQDGFKEDTKDSKDNGKPEGEKSSLKRILENEEEVQDAKKPKINGVKKDNSVKEYVRLDIFREFMSKKEICTLTRAELEQFCLQKMCEAITQTSKVGELNRKVIQQETIIETLRTKYASLTKQVRDLEVVHSRVLQEVRTKAKDGNIEVTPVKITRSVGLQVSLQPVAGRVRQIIPAPEVINPGIVKRKIQRTSLPNKPPSVSPPNSMPPPAAPLNHKSPNQGKGIKTILPKVYPAAEPKDPTSSLLGSYLQSPSTSKSPVSPGRKPSTAPTPSTSAGPSSATAKVIDLTDEDDTQKVSASTTSPSSGNIRVVPSQQLQNTTTTPVTTASIPRLTTYLVQPGNQQGQQVLLATSAAPNRPGQVRSTLMFKPVAPGQVPPGQRVNIVRPNTVPGITVLPSTSSPGVRPTQQIRFATPVAGPRPQVRTVAPARHPAPLPGPPAVQPSQPNWKAMPPKPTLKISRVGDGIVLSWRMQNNKDMSLYEDIGSYQLYAYQETSGPPSTDMWRKVGDVKALALPMACTLTQFTDGNKYHFAVRAVDVKSRVGPFSQPEQIALP